ncbi:MAG TPA: hypothetical protein VEF04_22515 [Blastocatellia bacterium]|nr:hypothetical protein [Blastocatellia bacterium]
MKAELTLRTISSQQSEHCAMCGVAFEAMPPMVAAIAHLKHAFVCIKCLQEHDPRLSKILSQMTVAFNSAETRKEPTKEEVLKKYSERELRYFTHYDGFKLAAPNYALQTDAEGHAITSGETYELMSSPVEVRVLIPAQTSRHDAVSLLRKIARMINKKGIYRESLIPEEGQ